MRLLRTEVRKLEQKIDMDEKMKKMGDMQLSTVTDGKKRKTILEQVCRSVRNYVKYMKLCVQDGKQRNTHHTQQEVIQRHMCC